MIKQVTVAFLQISEKSMRYFYLSFCDLDQILYFLPPMFNFLYQPGTGGIFSIYNISSCSWPFWRHSLYIFSSSLMFKDICSSGLTQKVQHWKLFVRWLQDPQGKQFFLILSAKHTFHSIKINLTPHHPW